MPRGHKNPGAFSLSKDALTIQYTNEVQLIAGIIV